jgi:hypothetical protein
MSTNQTNERVIIIMWGGQNYFFQKVENNLPAWYGQLTMWVDGWILRWTFGWMRISINFVCENGLPKYYFKKVSIRKLTCQGMRRFPVQGAACNWTKTSGFPPDPHILRVTACGFWYLVRWAHRSRRLRRTGTVTMDHSRGRPITRLLARGTLLLKPFFLYLVGNPPLGT